MIQPSIRGGICHISGRYARANNKLMGALYDPTKPTSYILYVDANNLYGWAMSQPLPDNDFAWLSEQECRDAETALRVKYTRDHYFGQQLHYIFEVDLDYPPELHDRDDDFPLAPEKMYIEQNITGEKQHELRAKYFGASCPGSRKLICSFLPKRHYVVLGHLLKFYLERGLRLVKVHRGSKFTASPYFAPYIEHNSQKRKENKDDPTKKDFYKLMNNAPYGKTIENVARRSDIRLCNDMLKARRLAEKPHCIDWRVFDNQLVGVEMRKLRANINKPFQHGFCVLEWSKLKMFSFYALLKDHFKDKVRMLGTDTDSLILQLYVEDIKQALTENPLIRNELDLGSVPADHPSGLGDPDDPNSGVVGKFKEELNLDPIIQWVGLRPKMYSITSCKATKWDPDNLVQPELRHKEVAKGC